MSRKTSQSGQTIIALIVFMAIAMTVTLAAGAVTLINLRVNSNYYVGEQSLQVAENGMENAVEQLLRNPNYSGETMAIDTGTATITVSGTTTKTITVVGVSGAFKRTITATATLSNNAWTISNWNETP